MRDQQIADLIAPKPPSVEGRLIAGENYASNQVMEAKAAYSPISTPRVADAVPAVAKWWTKSSSWRLISLLFGAAWGNVQPHSVLANVTVMLAVLNAGDSILGFDLSHGGHLTHGSTVNYSGKLYNHFYGIEETGTIDMDKVAATAVEVNPAHHLWSVGVQPRLGLRRFREIADSVVHCSSGHRPPSGLIAAGLLNNPMPHCLHRDVHDPNNCAAPRRHHHDG